MIENTFLFLPKIGYGTERKLWTGGIRHWDDFLGESTIPRISRERKETYDTEIGQARESVKKNDVSYFRTTLPGREFWRLFEAFGRRAMYLDIETTGLSFDCDITTVSLHDGCTTETLVLGKNLTRDAIASRLKNASLLLTFYGSAFDLPFIERKFSLTFPRPHIDLCFLARRVGLRGGLKTIERTLGLERETQGIDGFEAVRLWRRYRRGDKGALETLVKYNREDTENLAPIARTLTAEMKKRIFYNL